MHNPIVGMIFAGCLAGALAGQAQFMPFATRPATSFVPTGGYAAAGGFAGGDVDGDGRRDLVAGSGHYWRGAGGGAWATVNVPVFGTGLAPRLVDLDGDGRLDFVYGPREPSVSRPLTIVVNGSAGPSIVPLPPPGSSVAVQGCAVGDVDGDGDGDVLVAGVAGTGVPALVLLRNVGSLQLVADAAAIPPGLPFGLWPSLVDLDGDGDLDVIASTAAAGFVMLRNVGGSFVDARSSLPTTRIGHTFLCTGDFDGDGIADGAAVWWNGDFDMLWGTGAAAPAFTFQPATVAATAARALFPGDFDGDGDLDLVALRNGGLDLLRNLGNRQFAREPLIDEPISSIGVDDVDGDGAADLLLATTDQPSSVRCLFHARVELQDTGFALGFRVPTGTRRNNCPFAGDLDGDTRVDVAIPTVAGLAVDRSLGGGRYQLAISAAPTVGNASVEVDLLADIDGDGDPDLVQGLTSGLAVYRNSGAGDFAIAQSWALPNSALDLLRLGDVDGDGDVDIVFGDSAGLVLLGNLGNGSFTAPTHITAFECSACELADLDGDGDLDIVAGGRFLAAQVLLNDGAGNFASSASLAAVTNTMTIAAIDIDGDGLPDLAIRSGIPGALALYQNSLGTTFVDVSASRLPPLSLATTISSNVLARDFDGDGDVDLVTLATTGGTPVLLDNDGTGHFLNVSSSRFATPAVAFGVWRIAAADIDEDGDLDLLGGTSSLTAVPSQFVLTNHARHLDSLVQPRLGLGASFLVYTGPGFGASGAAVLAFAPVQLPLALPVSGFLGRLQIDPSLMELLPMVPTSPIGTSSVFATVPPSPLLTGLPVYLQAANLPLNGTPGFTNSVFEIVLP